MFKFLLLLIVIAAIGAEGYVLVTGNKIIVWQDEADAGEPVAVLGYNPAEYDMLVCRHFNGRSLSTSLYRHDADNRDGFSHCPLVVRSENGAQSVKFFMRYGFADALS